MTDGDVGISTELDDEQLAELDRLRTASLLSAGLAHEVANPLLGVLANLAEIERIYPRLRASMSAAHAERWEALADCLDQAHRSADAIADVIRDFQVFLRPASNRVERLVEPAPLVERAVRMASPRLRVTAEVHSDIAKVPVVKAPPSFITQIALNLLTNAAEALATSAQEHARIDVRLTHVDANVVLEVEDNGPGLSEAAMANVFEPHVSSKVTGTSLGLGLSICRALVRRLGGTISIESVPNERTCFRVTLPVAEPGH
ncbi:MAG TPA: HAMP domain-containing sensor histidine kinase [Polyangiaceae bacterium]|nr:HAMP domain-containing sensor histidine kinase [Polyangiaceae bacterium]